MKYLSSLLLVLTFGAATAGAQVRGWDRAQCVAYALANQPALRNVRLEDSIARLTNAINLAAWKPFVAASGGLTNNFQQQVSLFPDFMNPGETREVVLGQAWLSRLGLSADQLIYSPEVARDARLRGPRVNAARLAIREAEIGVEVEVGTAFYEALRVGEQIALSRADIERLERNLRDARLRYDNGLNDKVDYKRATIALNQARARLASARLAYTARLAELKAAMGYPADDELELVYDFEAAAGTLLADSLDLGDTRERVEVSRLLVEQELQDLNTQYFRRAWLPTVGAGAEYTYHWQASAFGSLYDRRFPAGLVALNLSAPLFSGARRFRQVELQTVYRRGLDLELEALRQLIGRERTVATSDYRSARITYLAARENVALAREIYAVVLLQYREGIEPFLEVVIAENDLRTAQNTALNALIDALVARLEYRRVSGTL